MSYTVSYTINGFSIKFSDLGIVLNPTLDYLSDPAFLEALKYAYEVYPVIHNLHCIEDYASSNFIGASDDFLEALMKRIKEAETQTTVPIWESLAICIAKVKEEKRKRDLGLSSKPSNAELRKKQKGFVYLLKSENGEFKIGKTKQPKNRMKMLGLQLPFEVNLIHLLPTDDMGELETFLHARFQEKRINGEWFSLVKDDVDYIKSLGGAS